MNIDYYPIILVPIHLARNDLIVHHAVYLSFGCFQIGFKNMQGVEKTSLSLAKATALVKDVFISAAERDIYTGDALFINIITKDGVKKETFPLRRD